jgi:hypothetical protein
MRSIQNWFVSSVGQVYTSPTIPYSIQPTAIPGTIVPSTPLPIPKGSSQSGIQGTSSVGADLSRPSLIYQPASLVNINPQVIQFASSQFIRRYDPNTTSWSNVTEPPTTGFLLQLTPVQSSSGAVLWFVGTGDNGKETLYRYVV